MPQPFRLVSSLGRENMGNADISRGQIHSRSSIGKAIWADI